MVEELFVFSEGEGEASVLLVVDFFLVVVDAEAPPSELFFFVVVEAEVEALVVPDFFAAVVVVDFLPVVVALVVDVVEAVDSVLWAHETTNATPARRVMKEKMVFFIGFCKGDQPVQAPLKPQAYSFGPRQFRHLSEPPSRVSIHPPTFGSRSVAAWISMIPKRFLRCKLIWKVAHAIKGRSTPNKPVRSPHPRIQSPYSATDPRDKEQRQK